MEEYKCSKCKRRATSKLIGYDYMCTYHFNKLVNALRIARKTQVNKCINLSCQSNYGGYCGHNRAKVCYDSKFKG